MIFLLLFYIFIFLDHSAMIFDLFITGGVVFCASRLAGPINYEGFPGYKPESPKEMIHFIDANNLCTSQCACAHLLVMTW